MQKNDFIELKIAQSGKVERGNSLYLQGEGGEIFGLIPINADQFIAINTMPVGAGPQEAFAAYQILRFNAIKKILKKGK